MSFFRLPEYPPHYPEHWVRVLRFLDILIRVWAVTATLSFLLLVTLRIMSP